jgi:outer membrane autotransporter protein
MAGVSLSSTALEGDTSGLPQSVEGDLWQAAVYAGYQGPNGMVVDGQFGYGRFDTETRRLANIGGAVFLLETSDEAETLMGEVGVGMRFVDRGWSATPRASLTATQIDYGITTETGGGPALTYERDNSTSVEGRLGYRLAGETGGVRPSMSFNYVHAFSDDPTVINANFAGGTGPYALFPLTSQDKDWVEIGLGLDVVRDNWRVGVAADTTVARDDIENRSIRA